MLKNSKYPITCQEIADVVLNGASNDAFPIKHREKRLSMVDSILCGKEMKYLYTTSTFGVMPNTYANEVLAPKTKQKYCNWDIAVELLNNNIEQMKKYVIKHLIDEDDKKLLHYLKE